MVKKFQFPEREQDLLASRLDELRSSLRAVPPVDLAHRTGTEYQQTEQGEGLFRLDYWQSPVHLRFPEFVAYDQKSQQALSNFDLTMLAYYFSISDGTPLSGRWISFSELPNGQFYAQAFQGYTSIPLENTFVDDLEGFAKAARHIGGRQPWMGAELGDSAFAFPVLARVSTLAVCWLGDEDFPSTYRILFDSAVSHHLTTDACAILGSTLVRRLIKAYKENKTGQQAGHNEDF